MVPATRMQWTKPWAARPWARRTVLLSARLRRDAALASMRTSQRSGDALATHRRGARTARRKTPPNPVAHRDGAFAQRRAALASRMRTSGRLQDGWEVQTFEQMHVDVQSRLRQHVASRVKYLDHHVFRAGQRNERAVDRKRVV